MKPEEMVRKAITTAYCLEFGLYLEIFGLDENQHQIAYAKGKWEMMQRNFGAWFCDLDTVNARLFMEYVLREK